MRPDESRSSPLSLLSITVVCTDTVYSRWTIWPVTLERRKADSDGKEGVLAEGAFNVSNDVLTQIAPTHHQFYGPWRAVTMQDGLDKWTGYRAESTRVEEPEHQA